MCKAALVIIVFQENVKEKSVLFLITRLNLNKFICQSHKGLTVSNTKQVTHVSKGPANRFDTFPFNDTGKSDQGSVKVLTDGSITDLKHYWCIWPCIENNIEFSWFKENMCFLESSKGREEIKVAKCRRQTDGESEKQQINEHYVALTSFFSETLNLHRFFYP